MLSNSVKSLLDGVKKISERISTWNKTRCDSLSACARQARKLVKLIRDDLTNNNHNASTSYGASRLSIIPLISKQCKDEIFDVLNDGEERYLSVYKCNCIALLIIEEAISQINDESVVGDYDFNSSIKLILNSLHTEFDTDSGKYTAYIQNFPSKSENLKLEKLKYCGKGIEYLKLKAERKSSMKSNFN
jgi:hypothetical protein